MCLFLLGGALPGCAAFHPVRGVPAAYLPDEIQGPRRGDKRTIDLSLLVRTPPDQYRVAAGDILSIYIPGVLGQGSVDFNTAVGIQPPIHSPFTTEDPPTIGFPIQVRGDHTISLPQIPPLNVQGMTLHEVEQALRKAYTVDQHIIRPDEAMILVSLQRPREHRVLVVRQETNSGLAPPTGQPGGLNVGATKKGTARIVRLRAYENDVLHALARAEGADGLPGLDAENTIYIIRRRTRAVTGPQTTSPPPAPTSSAPWNPYTPRYSADPTPARGHAANGSTPRASNHDAIIQPVVHHVPESAPRMLDTAGAQLRPINGDPTAPQHPPRNGPGTSGHSELIHAYYQDQGHSTRSERTLALISGHSFAYSDPARGSYRSGAYSRFDQDDVLHVGAGAWGSLPPMSTSVPAPSPTSYRAAPAESVPYDPNVLLDPAGARPVPAPVVPSDPQFPLYGFHGEAEYTADWNGALATFDPTIDNPHVIKIPVRLAEGEVPQITEQDIILNDGDIVFIESRETEVFYTGGLLGGGQYTLPRDYDLRVLEAISIAESRSQTGGGGSNALRAVGGVSALNQDVATSASRVVILRYLPNGQRVTIEVDLNKAMRYQEENILVQPGDMLILQYTLPEAVAAFTQRFLLEGALIGVAASVLTTGGR